MSDYKDKKLENGLYFSIIVIGRTKKQGFQTKLVLTFIFINKPIIISWIHSVLG